MARTLVLTNDFPPRIGGIESFVATACELLDRDVVVLASGPPGAAETDAERGYPVVRHRSLLLPTPALARLAGSILRRHGADRVLVGAALPLGLLAPALRRAGARRIVALTHGHEVGWAGLPGGRALLRRVGRDCDRLTAVSAYTIGRIAPALDSAARAELVRLSPPVDTAVFRPSSVPMAARPTRCVAVARFVAQKGIDTLLRAWRLLLDGPGPPDAELVLIGAGPQWPRLRRLADDLRRTGAVRFTGPLGRDAVVAELQAARVFALPSRTRLGGLNAEGFGLAAVEAAACGLPVVVGRSGGLPETLIDGRSGYVVSPDDPEPLADRIAELLADPDRASAFGQAGRSYVGDRFGVEPARACLREALGLTAGQAP